MPVWKAPLSEAMDRRLSRLTDLGERAVCLVLYATLVVRVGAIAPRAPWNLVILAPEGLVALFMILRRRPLAVTTRPWDWLVAMAALTLPMLVAPGGTTLVPPLTGVALVFAGLGLSIWATLCLGRSFGLAAANRGVVQSGPYRLLRHPIYAGYLVSDLGFLLMNPTGRNLGLYALALALTLARVSAEEGLLAADPAYVAFAAKVRHRLVPGLY
ncbi:MAG TPA: methyltransferase [Caulobacteraceae bacterium]|jgi:protein-S-isoprenylcysteine O-methyltransferase Ste14